ncbi:hypothetical protein ADK67_26450 [Saccharothrix sp. NRRL B-16348]|uniref:AMP-binding protein n=1 Tax=Saccharothrix sp. NRRL B-16348 TaxID=1415542 RepID=UPI0006AF37E1|nr:AMP-binding protein [Saccharothrix sp. NRRL B-16348]KOX21536.1 hypothetical protein ADK67_26450 [Saccharothrix sp. NRRL B-16348]
MRDRTLYEWFADTAERYPDLPALEVGDEVLTYRALRDAALGQAAAILAGHGRPPGRVALVTPRTVHAYVGYLAVQRLGASVVPLSPDHPDDRNLDITTRASVDVALVAPEVAGLFDALPARLRPTVVELGESASTAQLPRVPTDLEREAYLLFTSGSTGQPKGVPIRHRNLARYLPHNIARFTGGPGSRVSQVFGLTFDPSVIDMFLPWGTGGTVVVAGKADLYAPVDFIVSRGLTHWYSAPSVITVAQHFGNLPFGRATTLRHSIFAAEQVTVKHAELWRQVAPNSEIHDLYGPTEGTITVTEHGLPLDRERWVVGSNGAVPIGVPYPHMELVVLDEDGRPTDDGELLFRGPQRFDGYLNPTQNAGAFVSWEPGGPIVPHTGETEVTPEHWYRTGDRVRREHGVLVHQGRLDNQVKVMGHRIELGEVEAALRRHPDVVEAAVIAVTENDRTQLVAAYTGTKVADFELWLRTKLPAHVVPAELHHFEVLPVNDANGKIDRARLADLIRRS